MTRRSAAEIIAFHLGWDMAEMREYRYQPSRYRVAVYAIGDQYFCAPSAGKTPPGDFSWTVVGEHYGRKVYESRVD